MDTKIDQSSHALSPGETALAAISALTAHGDWAQLNKALEKGLDAGLTINQIKETLAQLYAYCGFPRSLQGVNTFMAVLADRKAKGITDHDGKAATPIDQSIDKYERGRRVLETLTKQPQSKPAKGFGEFSPRIDSFLKEHLFADVFDSDVLTYAQRELITIAALMATPGVEPMLQSHIAMGMNVGITAPQLREITTIIGTTISQDAAAKANSILGKVLENRK
jgi:alkylhydroperoxidase/carboxymuconolactone decarboxylase family protein YurZ